MFGERLKDQYVESEGLGPERVRENISTWFFWYVSELLPTKYHTPVLEASIREGKGSDSQLPPSIHHLLHNFENIKTPYQ